MKNSIKFLVIAFLALVLTVINTQNSSAQKKKDFTFVWSVYAGWNPWAYGVESGIVAKHAAKYGITIKILKQDYITSINNFTNGNADACVMTNMDALTIPVASGVAVTAIINGDFSNGNDKVEGYNSSFEELLRSPNYMVEYSVSHYMFFRFLDKKGKSIDDVKVVNISDEKQIEGMYKTGGIKYVTTWNPIAMNVAKVPGTHVFFSSADIPGEILDLCFVRNDVLKDNPDFAKALTGAWYEIMNIMSSRSAQAKSAKEVMAREGGSTLIEYENQLKTTAMFYNPVDAVNYTKGAEIKKTMERVGNFCSKYDLFGEGTSKGDIGIKFPDGTIQGNTNNILFIFSTEYMQMAAEGKLK